MTFKPKGAEIIDDISCYGDMTPEHNIDVRCDNEVFDEIFPDGFETWEKAVKFLKTKYPDIIELESC